MLKFFVFIVLHHFFVRVVLQIKNIWEFKSRVYFIILKGFKAKENPLQMNYQSVRCVCEEQPSRDIDLLVATFALKVFDSLTFHQLLKTVVNTCAPLYLER